MADRRNLSRPRCPDSGPTALEHGTRKKLHRRHSHLAHGRHALPSRYWCTRRLASVGQRRRPGGQPPFVSCPGPATGGTSGFRPMSGPLHGAETEGRRPTGVFLRFEPTRELITLDLPTFDRPRNATSGSFGAGKCATSLAAAMNRARTRIYQCAGSRQKLQERLEIVRSSFHQKEHKGELLILAFVNLRDLCA